MYNEKTHAESQISRSFDIKGGIAPMAEKAKRNLEIKLKNSVNKDQRVHYFAIGHTFKQMDMETVLGITYSETQERQVNRYHTLLKDRFAKIIPQMNTVLNNIRNVNTHLLHQMNGIKIDNEAVKSILPFLRDGFELAVIMAMTTKNDELSIEDYYQDTDENKRQKFIHFVLDKFYPINKRGYKDMSPANKQKIDAFESYRNKLKKLSIAAIIEHILFINLTENMDWKFGNHPVMTIAKGKYLSTDACLFLLCIFLYKNEATQLISKIKGFKRSEGAFFQGKRNTFTFFAKKYSSQDINSEENHLIKFRDIAQYLNKYPTVWRKEIEMPSTIPLLTEGLEKCIFEMELERCYGSWAEDKDFVAFARNYLLDNTETDSPNKILYKDIIDKNDEVRQVYELLKNNATIATKEYGDNFKGYVLKYVLGNYFPAKPLYNLYRNNTFKNSEEHVEKIQENSTTQKLKTRIAQNRLYLSYGRNQDRFMEFAIRYLAETNYFGIDAQFKMYQFYTTAEQEEYVAGLTKEEKDKLKYHDGKVVHYTTWQEHLARYDSWDMPFVVQNNAVYISLVLVEGEKTMPICLQRDLILYLLENALFPKDSSNKERVGAGKQLLTAYFAHHRQEATALKQNLEHKQYNPDEKANYKKLLPKRLIRHYMPKGTANNEVALSPYQKLLHEAERNEEKYAAKLEKIKADEQNYIASAHKNEERFSLVADFLKRNKGKQFKLQFVRKACHLMYFKEIYTLKANNSEEHHKHYHITRDEFNDFCKWMFAYDEVPYYKACLLNLFEQKEFLLNKEFAKLFEQSNGLDDLYKKVKAQYQLWIAKPDTKATEPTDSYTMEKYKDILHKHIWYINTHHFVKYLCDNEYIIRTANNQLRYKAYDHIGYLIAGYYRPPVAENQEPKSKNERKTLQRLHRIQLEDSYLYAIMLHYLQIDPHIAQKAAAPVRHILQQDIVYKVTDQNGKLCYDLVIPFNKIDAFVEMMQHKASQDEKLMGSYLANIATYLPKVKDEKDIKGVLYPKTSPMPQIATVGNTIEIKLLHYIHIHAINSHVMSASVRFTKIAAAIERYYIEKQHVKLGNKDFVSYEDMPVLKDYFGKTTRDKAYHFGLPNENYTTLLKKMEKEFIKKYDLSKNKDFFSKSSPYGEVMTSFLNTLHSEYFDHKEKNAEEKRSKAEEKYVNWMKENVTA